MLTYLCDVVCRLSSLLVFKLLSSSASIKVMQQCFFVNWSVTIVPREDETLPSIDEFHLKLGFDGAERGL